ncbi:metabotropic glutamate receptor 3 isoform X3 [Hydra vulgaris]|uniref:Metabotropic glutamate receptor 3 isoform X3 n=2 Tax=Hydra vulgaris TaxID=6087 RepID=A0ABM4BBT8_HYDVU
MPKKIGLAVCLKVSVFLILVSESHVFAEVIRGNGTFLLNGIFPIGSDGGLNIQSGFMMYQAMKYAVNVVNRANNASFLHGYKLAIHEVFDVNDIPDLQQKILKTFLDRIPFLIGPYSAQSSFIASTLTSVFNTVAISYSSSCSFFDNRKLETILRTVPSDKFRVQVALDLLQKLKWNYVVVISSYRYDGEFDAAQFINQLSSINICLEAEIGLPYHPTKSVYESVFQNLFGGNFENKERRRSIGLILFTNKQDTSAIFSLIQEHNLKNNLAIICIYGCTNYVEITQGKEATLNGTLSLDIAYDRIQGFENYYLNLNPNDEPDPELKTVWENIFNCSLSTNNASKSLCTGEERFSEGIGYYSQTPVHTVIYAVYAIADSLELLINHICNIRKVHMKDFKECFLNASLRDTYSDYVRLLLNWLSYSDGTLDDFKTPFLRINRTIKYDIHQFLFTEKKYKNVLKGSWELYRPNLNLSPEEVLYSTRPKFTFVTDDIISLVPIILCSDPCPLGEIRIKETSLQKSMCCWKCQKCQDSSISHNDSCVPCGKKEKVELNKCKAIPEIEASFTGACGNFFFIYIVLIIVGLCLVLGVTGLFINFKSNRIVSCSGRDLNCLILVGIKILFCCPIAYMIRPSTLSCVFRELLPGMGFLMCYTPLFSRTHQIYKSYVCGKTSVSKPASHPIFQAFVVFGLVFVQVLISILRFVLNLPNPNFVESPNKDFIIFQCNSMTNFVSLLVNLFISVVTMGLCTFNAFRIRHFPKNNNEAQHIGVTMYISCLIWGVFLPSYYLNSEKELFLSELLISALCIFLGYLTLIGLFINKVRLLLCPLPSDNNLNNQQMLSLHTI